MKPFPRRKSQVPIEKDFYIDRVGNLKWEDSYGGKHFATRSQYSKHAQNVAKARRFKRI